MNDSGSFGVAAVELHARSIPYEADDREGRRVPHSCPKRLESAPRSHAEPGLGNPLAACVHACSAGFARIGACPPDHPFKVAARVRIPPGAFRDQSPCGSRMVEPNHLREGCGICDTVPEPKCLFGLLSFVARRSDRVRPRGYVPVEQLCWRGIEGGNGHLPAIRPRRVLPP
jgi:hypothetical protein